MVTSWGFIRGVFCGMFVLARNVKRSAQRRRDERLGQSLVSDSSALRARIPATSLTPDFKSLCENSVVPPGHESVFPLFPALPCWAKLARPFRGWIFAECVPPDYYQRSSHTDSVCRGLCCPANARPIAGPGGINLSQRGGSTRARWSPRPPA
jgi:hypothetical protein